MSLKKRMSLRANFLLFLTGTVLITVIVTIIGFWQIRLLSKTYEPIAEDSLKVTKAMGDLLYKFRQVRIEVRSVAMVGNTPERTQKFIDGAKKAAAEFAQEIEKARPMLTSDDERVLLEKVSVAWVDFQKLGQELEFNAGLQTPEGILKAADLIRDVCPAKTAPLEAAIVELINLQTVHANKQVADAVEQERQAKIFISLVAGTLITLVLVFALRYVANLSKELGLFAGGIGHNAETLENVVGSVKTSSEELMSAVEIQSQSIESASSALQELNHRSETAVHEAEQAAQHSESSRSLAQKGEHSAKRLYEEIESHKIATQQTAEDLKKAIEEVSRISGIMNEVTTKVTVINEIVNQTKLLSFNASVEAARAGEHGKGFAVVAEEIGQLARRSGAAAVEINSVITSSGAMVVSSIESNRAAVSQLMNLTEHFLNSGSQLAESCRNDLTQILSSSDDLNRRVSQLKTLNFDTQKSLRGIEKEIQSIQSSSQHTATAAQGNISLTGHLTESVEELTQVSHQLDGIIKGTKAA